MSWDRLLVFFLAVLTRLTSGKQAAEEIAARLREDAVSFDEEAIEAHGFSDWSTSNSTGRSVAIVYPKSTEEVSLIASICNANCVPIGKKT